MPVLEAFLEASSEQGQADGHWSVSPQLRLTSASCVDTCLSVFVQSFDATFAPALTVTVTDEEGCLPAAGSPGCLLFLIQPY